MEHLRFESKKPVRDFEPHPEGAFVAICRDIYITRKTNPRAGATNKYGGTEPEEIVRLVMEFLTEDQIEINGQMLPRFASIGFATSWHVDSRLRRFVSAWDPAMGKLESVDLENLVGRGAYLVIQHHLADDGRVYANIVSAAMPPRGVILPEVPVGFVRRMSQ